MNANETLDYRPHFSLKRDVDAPLSDPELYVNPDEKISTPLSIFHRNRPSTVLEDVSYVEEEIRDKLVGLLKDDTVLQYNDSPGSLGRQILYSSIESVEGSTNVLLYDRLKKLSAEIKSTKELFVGAYFGKGKTLQEVKETEEELVKKISSFEVGNDFSNVNYQTFYHDLKAFELMKNYFYILIDAADKMLVSNEPLEFNVYKANKSLIPLYELQNDRVVKDILEGKQAMDISLGNDIVGNKFRRLYNLRTKQITVSSGLTAEEKLEHKDRIRDAEEEIAEQIKEAGKDLYKAIQSQSLNMAKFNLGFRNKCENIYNLKGGIQI